MKPDEVEQRIEELVKEEQAIQAREAERGPTDGDRQRLAVIRIALDELWDLQRRQRARAEAGLDPAVAELNDAARVEGYEQ
jgi:c-di-GMP-binding flagellar brake protein YcgR